MPGCLPRASAELCPGLQVQRRHARHDPAQRGGGAGVHDAEVREEAGRQRRKGECTLAHTLKHRHALMHALHWAQLAWRPKLAPGLRGGGVRPQLIHSPKPALAHGAPSTLLLLAQWGHACMHGTYQRMHMQSRPPVADRRGHAMMAFGIWRVRAAGTSSTCRSASAMRRARRPRWKRTCSSARSGRCARAGLPHACSGSARHGSENTHTCTWSPP